VRTAPLAVARVVAVVLGILLVVAGLAAMAWSLDLLGEVWPQAPDQLATAGAQDVAQQIWWPWVLGVVGVVLALLALWWLTALVPTPAVRTLDLPGSGAAGHLWVDAGETADAAVRTLAERIWSTPDGGRGRGRVVTEGGRLVLDTRVPLSLDVDLADAAQAADGTAALVHDVLGRDDLLYRAVFHLPSSSRRLGRVQ
jgi:hypothetical protein